MVPCSVISHDRCIVVTILSPGKCREGRCSLLICCERAVSSVKRGCCIVWRTIGEPASALCLADVALVNRRPHANVVQYYLCSVTCCCVRDGSPKGEDSTQERLSSRQPDPVVSGNVRNNTSDMISIPLTHTASLRFRIRVCRRALVARGPSHGNNHCCMLAGHDSMYPLGTPTSF